MTSGFVIYTPNGYLADWSRTKGAPTYTRNIADAALWRDSRTARDIANRCNGAVLTATGQLLTVKECK